MYVYAGIAKLVVNYMKLGGASIACMHGTPQDIHISLAAFITGSIT
jgi:hypothetical protein